LHHEPISDGEAPEAFGYPKTPRSSVTERAGSPRPVLLRMDFRYAHEGASSITAWAEKLADELSFAAWAAR